MFRWVRNRYFVLGILMLCFLGVRIVVALSSETLARQGEEAYVGAIAQGIIEGWARAPWDFRATEYVGGSIVNAFFSVPFFLLFGPCMGALVSTSILFQLLGLVCLFIIVEKSFGIRAASLCSSFYIFPPPLLMARSLIFNGSHEGSVVFGIVLFCAFFKILDKKHLTRWHIFLGFISGLSVWYVCSNMIFIIVYTFLWFFYDRKFFLNKKYFLYCISFLIGLLPWIIFNFAGNSKGIRFPEYSFLVENFADHTLFFKKMWNLIFHEGYKIFIFDEFSFFYGKIFNILYYVIFAAAFLTLGYKVVQYFYKRFTYHGEALEKFFQQNDKIDVFKKMTFLLVPCFFVLAYSSSTRNFELFGFGIADYRYALLLFPFIFIIISLFLCMLLRSRFLLVRNTAWVLYAVLIFISIIGNWRFIYSYDFKNNYLRAKACNFEVVGRAAYRRFGDDIVHAKQLMHVLKDDNQISEAYRGYGQTCVRAYGGISGIERYVALSETIESSQFKNEFLAGIGEALADCQYFPDISSLGNFLAKCDEYILSKNARYWLYSGMFNVIINRPRSQFSISEIISVVPENDRYLVYFRYGLKMGAYAYGKSAIKDCVEAAENIKMPYNQYYYNGIGAGIAYFFSGDLNKIIRQIKSYPLSAQESLLQGVGMHFHYINYYDRSKTEGYFLYEFPKEYVEYFRQGIAIFDQLVNFSNPSP